MTGATWSTGPTGRGRSWRSSTPPTAPGCACAHRPDSPTRSVPTGWRRTPGTGPARLRSAPSPATPPPGRAAEGAGAVGLPQPAKDGDDLPEDLRLVAVDR